LYPLFSGGAVDAGKQSNHEPGLFTVLQGKVFYTVLQYPRGERADERGWLQGVP
jgi:hypothetical protein